MLNYLLHIHHMYTHMECQPKGLGVTQTTLPVLTLSAKWPSKNVCHIYIIITFHLNLRVSQTTRLMLKLSLLASVRSAITAGNQSPLLLRIPRWAISEDIFGASLILPLLIRALL